MIERYNITNSMYEPVEDCISMAFYPRIRPVYAPTPGDHPRELTDVGREGRLVHCGQGCTEDLVDILRAPYIQGSVDYLIHMAHRVSR